MNAFIIFMICITVLLLMYLIYIYQYSLQKPMSSRSSKCAYNHQDVLITDRNRIRCLPETEMQKARCHDIGLYNDNQVVKQKGFLNELMYKPQYNMSELQFENKLINNKMSMSNSECEDNPTENLPIANVNVHYLLQYNTAKLSL